MRVGQMAKTMAQPSSTMFFNNVSVLLSLIASPKHPQSLMGLAMANHSVTTVMIAMKTSVIFDTTRRLMASRMNTPKQNSKADKTTEAPNVIQSGTMPCHANASR